MVGVDNLAGLTLRQTRDGLRKVGFSEFFMDQYPPTREGTDRLLAHVDGLFGWDGMHRHVPYHLLEAEELLQKAKSEVARFNEDNSAKERKQKPKSLSSIVMAAQKERWPSKTDVRRKQLDVFFAGMPKKVSRIDINTAARSA